MALKHLRLDEVWWLVATQNPLKPMASMATLTARLDHAQATARHPRIRVGALESQLHTQFTVDTVGTLTKREPGTNFVWLMGADNVVNLSLWRHWPRIFDTLPVAVLARHDYDSRALAGPAACRFWAYRLPEWRAATLAKMAPPAWVFLRVRHHPASATAIRAHLGPL